MRWLLCALATSALVLAGCGSSGGEQSSFEDGGADVTVGTPGPGFQLEGGSEGGGPKCAPLDCAAAGANCGPVADGCGKIIQCGDCTAPAICGGGGLNRCGGTAGCKPKTCADLGAGCGPQGDGCGKIIQCGDCTAPATCGGGGTGSQCGGTAGCVKKTACPKGMNCGSYSDGCGGAVDCSGGAACPAGEFCGGGGVTNVCGNKNTLPDGGVIDAGGDGGSTCVPIPQATACASQDCGVAPDGCGNTYSCGTCTKPGDQCGYGGVPDKCGQGTCTPITACPANIKCGTIGNRCGGTIDCGGCTATGDTCGGGGTPYQCGHPSCTPATTCPSGVNCGPWPDGCGGTIPSCGTCTKPAICGGSGVRSQCGDGTDGGPQCSGLQCDIPNCNGGTTSISGKVYDPAGKNPLYNVVVYIPQSTPSPFTHGPSCDSCASLYTGNPLVAATTGADGSFSLTGVPVPASGTVPLVIQIGKWRRQMTVSGLTRCVDNPQPDKSLLLPSKQQGPGVGATVDDLPQIAVSTGGADSMECLFKRVGIDPSEYQDGAGGSGHVHVFKGTASQGSAPAMSSTTPRSFASLYDQASDLDPYDILVLSCEGHETQSDDNGDALTSTMLDALHSYASAGGRVFASHFHYAWFNHGHYALENLAKWTGGTNAMSTGGKDYVDTLVQTKLADGGAFVRGQAMDTWLGNVNALNTSAPVGELRVTEGKHNADVTAANTHSQVWLVADKSSSAANATEYFSFDTPTEAGVNDAGQADVCGRVVYSDLHVGSASGDYASSGSQPIAPTDCANADLSAQEKALEFMLFDLSSCVQSNSNLPVPTPTCTPLTQCPANIVCGSWPDGCGGSIPCGACTNGKSCVNGACVGCVPESCSAQGIACGPAGDGCGGTQQCPSCAQGQLCQGGQCITPGCTKVACPANIHCGPAGDGCGGVQQCGSCPAGQTCGGGGTPGVCGAADADVCTPLSCSAQGLKCGQTGDGCGNLIDCGSCPTGQTCGGGGTPGVCGAPSCTPKGCGSASCGQVADGCGGLTSDCGQCAAPDTCGGGGAANQCGHPTCTPRTCQQAGANCGPIGDGCGSILQCGDCTPPQTCGGGGTPSVCGGGIK